MVEDGTGAYLIAGGPGSDPKEITERLRRAIVACGADAPAIAYIGTAMQDSKRFFDYVEPLLRAAGASSIDAIPLAADDADVEDAKRRLESADAVFITGGEPADGMYWLERHGLVGFLRRLFADGKLFFGISAGCIMMGAHWFRLADPDDAASAELIDCLGLVPTVFDAHGEDEDWCDLRLLLGLMGPGAQGYGLPRDGASYADRAGRLVDFEDRMPLFANLGGRVAPVDTLGGRFEQQVALSPEAIALVCGGDSMTYAELDAAVNCRARLLRSRGVGRGSFVGIVMDHSFELIIDILAVLKSGAAYVPMEPTFPRGRIASIIEQAGIRDLFTRRDFAGVFTDSSILIFEDADGEAAFGSDSGNYPSDVADGTVDGDDVAYVLFTSGTTGKPKGVEVLQRNVCNYVDAFRCEFHPTVADRMLQNSVCTFDIFAEEVFPILLSGGALVIATEEQKQDMGTLTGLMERTGVTMVSGFPYFIARICPEHIPSSLRLAISGGDTLRPEHVEHLLGRLQVYNTYGPTETTVCATYYRCPDALPAGEPVPIGRPVHGVRVRLLDGDRREVDRGQVGEIGIVGAGVSLGYLGNGDETAARFVDDPFGRGRMYLSGDMGYERSDGQIVFVKRKDDQVMIEGRRVEPCEVEQVMGRFPGVAETVVKPFLDDQGYPYLVGYLSAWQPVDLDELRSFMEDYLPDFMIPESLVALDEMPTAANGKIDRKHLPPVARKGAPTDFSYRRATPDDLDMLVGIREEVMREVWELEGDWNLDECLRQTRDYYLDALSSGEHATYLAYRGDAFVGCGGISYYRVMPTWDNPTGRKAYVMNMYVRAAFRRQGVASRLLDLLVDDAHGKGITFISLEASEDGRPFYATHGFAPQPDEMRLTE